MTLLILIPAALSSDPPPRPEVPEPISGECEENYGLDAGQILPTALAGPSNEALCSAVAVPLSEYQDFLKTEAWGEHVAEIYRLDTTHLEQQVAWYQNALESERNDQTSFNRPATWIAVGWGLGAAAVLVSAYALQAVQ